MSDVEPTPHTRPPSVDALARSLAVHSTLPHPLLVQCARKAIAEGGHGQIDYQHHALQYVHSMELLLMRDAVNATGVLLHTNLGRAPISIAGTHRSVTVEFDLRTGKRGDRHHAVSELFHSLIGSEAAIVVNNNASAVLLVLAALAKDRDVVVSRGESVEIGGGFRVPDVMEQSGAHLVDVGTTNKTRLRDYEKACSNKKHDVALVMKIHPSNFSMKGFVEETTVAELAGLPVPVVVDIGSGLLDNNVPWASGNSRELVAFLHSEPAAKQTLESGADLVLFSGDKLLGGPQCGVIAGKREYVEACAQHPLMRALRPGGHTLVALQNVLLSYLTGNASAEIPFWSMATAPIEQLRARAESIATQLRSRGTVLVNVDVVGTDALPGAGSAPGTSIPSVALRIAGDFSSHLRHHDTPVIARVEDSHTFLDLRSLMPQDDAIIVDALASIVFE